MEKTQINFYDNRMVIIKNLAGDNIIFYENIVRIVCDHPYLAVHSIGDEKERLIYYGLEELAQNLPPYLVLCNKSTIVNLNFVKQLKGKTLYLKTGAEVTVSRRKYCAMKERLKQIFIAKSMNEKKMDSYVFTYGNNGVCACYDSAGHAENCSANTYSAKCNL